MVQVLEGFLIPQYMGWLSGTFFIKAPRKGQGTISVEKKSLYTIYASILYILLSGIWIDFHIRHFQLLQHQNSSNVEKFLTSSLFVGGQLFDLFFRSVFFFRCKLIGRFLKTLETDVFKIKTGPGPVSGPESGPVSGCHQGYGHRKIRKSYKNLILFVQCYHFLSSIFTTLWFHGALMSSNGFLPLPSSIYPILFLIFGQMPLLSSFCFSFSFVIVSTIHILWIFEDFIAFFEERIASAESLLHVEPSKRDLGDLYSIPSIISKSENPCDTILNKFEHLKMLCNLYDRICGPLLMGLLIRAVFIIISAANSILLNNSFSNQGEDKKFKMFLNTYHFVTEMSQLALLQLGYMIQRRLRERKEELHRKVILMTNLGPRDQMKEAINVINGWHWSLSGGPGFFQIDRPLLNGVVSSLMTYVTILFQMNVVNVNVTTESSIGDVNLLLGNNSSFTTSTTRTINNNNSTDMY